MAGVGWCFPILTGGGEEGYTSNDIEAFKGEELYINLARETCQNSLDAKDPDSCGPVRVEYSLRSFNVADYSFFTQYAEHIRRCRRYWDSRDDGIPERLEQLLSEAEGILAEGHVTALVISDYNTPGLIGSGKLTGSFNALVYAEGVSYKQSDTSAGSFGIGRNAPFACSALSCVCYNTKASDGGTAFAGIAKLATAYDETGNKKTRKNGRYQYNDDESDEWRPIKPEDNDDFAGEFARSEYGTDVIVLGFDASDEWQDQLIKAVLKNFFIAIHEEKLVVVVDEETISADTISSYLERYADEKEIARAREYYKAVVESPRNELSILGNGDADAELYIRTASGNESFKGVAWFRGNGMLIRSYRPMGIFRPYAAVFIAKGELDKLLRLTEPARHNDWDYKRLSKGSDDRSRAKKAIDNIKSTIKAELKDACESVVDMSIDAAGAASYLPDREGGGSQEGGGDDVLRPLITIGKQKVSKPAKKHETVSGKRGYGKPVEGRAGNRAIHPDPTPDTDPPVPVSDSGNSKGVREGKGKKTITRPAAGLRRITALAPNAGLYRFVMMPKEGAEKAYVSCSIVGENGRKEPVVVKNAMLNGRQVPVMDGGTIGPFGLTEGELLQMVITFEDKLSMALDVETWIRG